ncbi:hypothetical protein QBC37DRAFT_373581 [Rhypophila decipiens]|uniref:Uncharacterized protein n=1 Tax=Rhypophila decipiens TaxID=261697 RepID=A0AAN6Y8J3_9PEZI|nr:hypothetical protein QBC37DRAFT_373581 [Rhypophila decipiens]
MALPPVGPALAEAVVLGVRAVLFVAAALVEEAEAAVAVVARGAWYLYCSDGLTNGYERLGYYCDQNGRMHGTWSDACDGACDCLETDTICDDPRHCQ